MRRGKVYSFIDVFVGLLLGTGGALAIREATFQASPVRFSQGILGFYLILFSGIIVLTAFFYSAFLARYFAAAYSFIGKAFGYIFLGCLCLRTETGYSTAWASNAIGGVIIAIGMIFLLLQFISAAGSPVPLLYFGTAEEMAARPIGPPGPGQATFGLPPHPSESVPKLNLSSRRGSASTAESTTARSIGADGLPRISPDNQTALFVGSNTSVNPNDNPFTGGRTGNPFRDGGNVDGGGIYTPDAVI